jgi:hypothetical protein
MKKHQNFSFKKRGFLKTCFMLLVLLLGMDKNQASVIKTTIYTHPKDLIIISGKVTEEDGTAIPYASVNVKGTTKGTNTDEEGKYSIEVENEQSISWTANNH